MQNVQRNIGVDNRYITPKSADNLRDAIINTKRGIFVVFVTDKENTTASRQ